MLKEKGCQDVSLWEAVLEASLPTAFAISGGKGEAAISNKLHDHAEHAP